MGSILTSWSWLLVLIIGSLTVIVAGLRIFGIYRRYRFRRLSKFERYFRRQERLYDEMRYREQAERPESQKKTIAEIIEEKKERFSDVTSVSFQFVDKDEIESFYNDTFREPTIESLISEMTGEVTGEVKGGLPKILESRIGGRDIGKWISTMKLPGTSLSGMFIKYQREAIRRDEVTLGLEELDVELNELQEFDSAIENLKTSFGLDIEPTILETYRSKLRQKAAETTFAKLEGATGWVVIEGKFLISKKENIYDCSLTHPVNEFLPPDEKKIEITFSLPVESIEPRYAGNYAGSEGRMIPLRVFGKVWRPIDRNANVWELQITPLVVY